MTRDHWKQASAVWLRRAGLSRVSRAFGASTRKRQRGLKKVQPKVFQIDSCLPCLLNRPLGRISRFGNLLYELWFADCVRNRRTVCSDRNSAKPTVLALDTVQTKALQWRLIPADISSHCMHSVSHTALVHGLHYSASAIAHMKLYLHHAVLTFGKSVAIDIGCYAKNMQSFSKMATLKIHGCERPTSKW